MRLRLIRIIQDTFDHIRRPPLDFIVHVRLIRPDDAQTQQLESSEKQHQDDERRQTSWCVGREKKANGHLPDYSHDREGDSDNSEPGDDVQRHIGE